jgi:hypothetical protein
MIQKTDDRAVAWTKIKEAFTRITAEILVASNPDLFGGKLCAALDRQHAGNLFDVRQL